MEPLAPTTRPWWSTLHPDLLDWLVAVRLVLNPVGRKRRGYISLSQEASLSEVLRSGKQREILSGNKSFFFMLPVGSVICEERVTVWLRAPS